DLNCHVPVFDGIVPIDRPFTLDREHAVEIGSQAGHKGRTVRLGGHNGEPFVKLSDIAVPEERVGLLGCRQSSYPEFLGKTALPGAETSLAAASRLRRVGRNKPDAVVSQCTPDLGERLPVDRLSGLWGYP